jgi:UDP-N-acetylmuramate dehydrogenase
MYEIKENYLIKPKTTFQIGGNVKYYVEVEQLEDLNKLFKEIKESALPYFILGGGSNLVFSSKGYNGWVIKLVNKEIDQNGGVFDVNSGVNLSAFANLTAKLGYDGLQNLFGIPGTVGGAVRGNAGAYGKEVGQFVSEVLFFDISNLKFKSLKKEKCEFAYRESIFSKKDDLLITQVRFEFKERHPAILKDEILKIKAKRDKIGYNKYPSAGSVFKNYSLDIKKLIELEKKGNLDEDQKFLLSLAKDYQKKSQLKKIEEVKCLPAGYLIEKVGLANKQIGGAKIFKNCCNIIINSKEATSFDVIELIALVKERVRGELGIKLKEEVVFVG